MNKYLKKKFLNKLNKKLIVVENKARKRRIYYKIPSKIYNIYPVDNIKERIENLEKAVEKRNNFGLFNFGNDLIKSNFSKSFLVATALSTPYLLNLVHQIKEFNKRITILDKKLNKIH